jgi:photosystem II stability/assembly factor-like uncharacterized protein
MIRLRHLGLMIFAAGFAFLPAGASHSQQYLQSMYQEMSWRMIGPFRGGRTRAACGVPGEPNVFYIGQVNGGVWKSDDYGRTWHPIFDNEPTQSIGAIVVAPSDPKVIYVASGEGLQRPDLSVGDGIYKSTDAGRTWTYLGLRDGQQIPALAIDPHDPDRVFAAVLGHPYGPNVQRGIFRSTDGGKTWKKVLYVNENTGGDDVAIDPADPNVVYATLWEARQGPWEDHNAYGGTDGGIFKSTDGGVTWHKLTRGLPKGLVHAYVAIAPSRPSRLFATVAVNFEGDYQTGHGLGIYRSDNAGESWHRVTNDPRPAFRIGGGDLPVPKVDPRNPDVVYSTSIETWKSMDGGKTWTAIRGAPGGDDYQNIWINPKNPNIILLAADQGAIVTVNGGKTWSSWYNQPTAQLYHVIATNTFPYRVCGGQQESGSVCISSRGNDGAISFRNWHPVGVIEYGYVAPDPLNPNIIYGAGRNQVSRFHWDTGQVQNVTPIPVMEGKYRTDRTEPILFSPVDHHLIYYAANVLFKTIDGGHSWQTISPDLTREHPGVPASLGTLADKDPYSRKVRGAIYAIAPSFKSVNTIWVGTDDGLIWLTRDGGKNWKNVTPPEVTPWSKVTQLVASHFDDETAYASVSRFRIDDLRPYIICTHDGGKTWKLITTGLPDNAPVNTVREDPVRKGLLFAGTERAVWVSIDDGGHWQSLQLNLPHTSMRDLWVHDNDLIVGTHGRSFWILDDITPLRQITAEVEHSTAGVFKPEPAIRVRRNTNTDTPLPPDEPFGQNPPNGAIIDYYLSKPAHGVLTLEILDDGGRLVRRYSSSDKPGLTETQLKKVFIPLFWLQKFRALSTSAGMHRWIWDLRYAPPKSEHFSYPISAIPHDTPRTPLGPLALPGQYTVRLTVDGHIYSAPFTVKMDPRVKTPRSGLEQAFHMEIRLVSLMNSSYVAIAEARALNEDLAVLSEQEKGPLAATVMALKKKVAEVLSSPEASDESEAAAPTLESVTAQASSLYKLVAGVDATPTAVQTVALETLEHNFAVVTKRWKDLKSAELPALNGRLRQMNHPELRLRPQPLPQTETREEE